MRNITSLDQLTSPRTLVKVYTSSCGPCGMLDTTIRAIMDNNPDVEFCSINALESTELITLLALSSVPAVILFKGDQEVTRAIGYQTQEQLNTLIKELR